jgi:Arc/MetJ-type ribon-helix-helix transcriptional regulator
MNESKAQFRRCFSLNEGDYERAMVLVGKSQRFTSVSQIIRIAVSDFLTKEEKKK